MSKFVGINSNGRIQFISDTPFSNDKIKIIGLTPELENINDNDLINNYKLKNNKIVNISGKRSAKDLKVAFVNNYKTQCGIASYSEKLLNSIIPHVGDYKLFIERDEFIGNIFDMEHVKLDKYKVFACWRRGESLQELVNEIKAYGPDIILIQHEFGLFPNARYWLAMLTQLAEFRLIVTMHSVFYHKDKTIIEAPIPEIVVHLEGAKQLLKDIKKISGSVYVIPHGCDPCISKERLWNFYKTERTFMSQGFGFRYKNFENSIIATSILKQKYDDVFFTAIFSESPSNVIEHQKYYDELISLSNKLRLQDNVSIIRGFQHDNIIDNYLRINKAAVFPYATHPGHEVFGASGAARTAMAANIPIITSSIPHFSDLPTIKADSPEEIARELNILFCNKSSVDKQLLIQENYINDNSWAAVAQKYINIFEATQTPS